MENLSPTDCEFRHDDDPDAAPFDCLDPFSESFSITKHIQGQTRRNVFLHYPEKQTELATANKETVTDQVQPGRTGFREEKHSKVTAHYQGAPRARYKVN